MCIETIEPGLPLHTLIKIHQGEKNIQTHNKRPILTTDYDALMQYAMIRAKMNPTATYTISRVNSVQEI